MEHDLNSHSAHEGGHGTKATYNVVFAALFVLTIAEVVFAELPFPGLLHYGGLIALTIAKGWLVVAYYMHLKYEPPIYTWIFVVPLIMATATVLSLQSLAGY